jgi:histidinol-phosphate/aromatic aminotransferase/cobyric acid decarboxylase-like protein
MKQYQERVINEEKELSDKLDKLNTFIDDDDNFALIDVDERKRLIRQARAMADYIDVLNERIEAF